MLRVLGPCFGEKRPPCEPAQSKTLRSRTRGFVNHYETLRLRSNSITSGQTYTPARKITSASLKFLQHLFPEQENTQRYCWFHPSSKTKWTCHLAELVPLQVWPSFLFVVAIQLVTQMILDPLTTSTSLPGVLDHVAPCKIKKSVAPNSKST